MKYDYYRHLSISKDFSVFDFDSVGKNGTIRKRIVFIKTESEGVYNLELSDVLENGYSDFDIVTNNGDVSMVLATIADAVDLYTGTYPERWIFFTGNTESRTRLCRKAIGLNIFELSNKYAIYVQLEDSILWARINPYNR